MCYLLHAHCITIHPTSLPSADAADGADQADVIILFVIHRDNLLGEETKEQLQIMLCRLGEWRSESPDMLGLCL